jgi:hypothetical protein
MKNKIWSARTVKKIRNPKKNNKTIKIKLIVKKILSNFYKIFKATIKIWMTLMIKFLISKV